MSQSIVADRYALALFKAAQEQNQTELIQEQLIEIKKAFQQYAELEELLQTPRLSNAEKKELLSNSLKDAHSLVQNTMFVLLDKKRVNETANLVDSYVKIANDAAGVAEATVYSTYELTEQEKNAISSTFAAKLGKQSLQIENILDPNLIGGIRIQIGNRIYDSSLSGKLNRLKRDLIGS